MFRSIAFLTFVAAAADLALAAPSKRASCSSYTIVETRGTSEAQGPSIAFKTMNSNILAKVSGGKEYDIVYPAAADQDSTEATTNIVKQIQDGLAADPDHCFVLEGYSQGAAATVNAMPKLTGDDFDAVKAVFLVGDPYHKPGLSCNVDATGGSTTKSASGLEEYTDVSIPDDWVSKTLDVCLYGDGVCDTASGYGVTETHLTYGSNADIQNLGTKFVEGLL